MKISVARDVFTEAVSWVARTIPTRPAVPVLAGLKMVATDDGNVALGSRDSDITSHADIEAEVAEAGEVLVNGRWAYWASKSPMPGGVAYENFEVLEPFRDGQEFIYWAEPIDDGDFDW